MFRDISLEESVHKTCLSPFLINTVHLGYNLFKDSTRSWKKMILCDLEIGLLWFMHHSIVVESNFGSGLVYLISILEWPIQNAAT